MPAKTPVQSTILVLSSEPLMRQVIQEALERAGYVVLATGHLGDAVDRLRECKPDLLIIHPYVDTMSGHDAAKYLHARCPAMQILMFAETDHRSSAPGEGPRHAEQELTQHLRSVSWLTHRENPCLC